MEKFDFYPFSLSTQYVTLENEEMSAKRSIYLNLCLKLVHLYMF